MKAAFFAMVLVPALAAAPLSQAASAKPRPAITEPDWLSRPNGDDVANAYPKLAWQLGIGGRAILACGVDDFGRLQGCTATSETPQGLGFGAAALSMTGAFHMRPMTRNGEPVSGGEVRIPLRFLTRELKPPPPIGPPTSPRALELARELVGMSGVGEAMAQKIEDQVGQIERRPRSDLSDQAREAVATALRRELPTLLARIEANQAQAYASLMDESELAAMLAFGRSPLGRGFGHWDEDTAAVEAVVAKAARRISVDKAREAFCARTNCDPQGDRQALLRDADGPKPKVAIPDPVWDSMPGAAAIALARPKLAQQLAIAGHVRLTCTVGELGAVGDCAVANETPADLGFGAAALSLAGRYRLAPRLQDMGAEGETVAVIVDFPAPVQGPLPPNLAPTPRSPDSQALALQLMEAADSLDAIRAAWREQARRPEAALAAGVSRQELDRVLEAIQTGSEAGFRSALEMRAAWLTHRYSDAELKAALAFWRTPAGQAVRAKSPRVRAIANEHSYYAGQRFWYAAGERFCASWACGADALQKAPFN